MEKVLDGNRQAVNACVRYVVTAMAAAMVAYAASGALVWDATKDGRLMTATNDSLLFTGVKLSDVRLAKCWFNRAGRVRADGTRAMSQGEGSICHVRRLDDGRALEAQCQLFDCGYTKCVKLRLSQRGDDVTGRILYAKYCTKRGFSDVVGADFDVLDNTAPQPAYSVLPNGRVTNGYNVDWLALREVGSAEDNIPDAAGGVMPTDKVTEWMENAVDPDAWTRWCNAHPAPFHLFGEDRQYAVRNNIIPVHWLAKGNRAAERFHGVAQPGEFYPFQVCVASEKARTLRWNAKTDLKVSRITPETCAVAAKGVKPIWVMVDIPKDAAGKTLRGEVCVEDVADATSASLPFEIEVKGDVLADGGIGDAWRLARLKWLNSDIGSEDTVTKPYEPIVVDKANRMVRILGRELVLGVDGLPAQVVSYFSGSNTRIIEKGMNLLAAPVRLEINGGSRTPRPTMRFTEITPAHAAWRAETDFGGVKKRIVEGRIDFAGECRFRVRVEGAKVEKMAFEMKMPADVARFREGLGTNGGFFTEEKIEQKWDPQLNRDAVWLGSVNGGIVVRFKGANYRRPLINAYYAWQKLKMPESWASGGGKITLMKSGKEAVVRAEAGAAPEGAEWNFDLYITPFHKLDMKTHLGDRYLHFGQRNSNFNATKVREAGATVVNLHHNTIWNPYINYPYNDDGGPLLKKAVKDAHAAGLLLKVYYTTRELTQNLPEFFALKSLDGEALLKRDASVPGWPCTNRGGPHPWLREHVGLDILPAWRENVRFPQAYPPRLDLAVITAPDTRWDNFYLEGLNYLVREYGIDGLYIDDTALTGESMQRARRILDRDGKRRLVDNHSWNHHNPLAGSGSTNLAFIDLYPYFDLLWRGEGFSNNTPSDFWLIERSGIAFGIAGEMLGRGNPFRGLLFGMTDRAGWGGGPIGLWKFFDEVGLGDKELVGWWDDECPVKVDGSDEIKVSVWKGRESDVLVIANFSKDPRTAQLRFNDGNVAWTQPEIAGVQKAANAPDLTAPVEVPGGSGMILVAKKNQIVKGDMMNPFMKIEEFPNFPAMTPAAAEEALPKLLADAKRAIDELEKNATPTWDGFVRPLNDATRTLWYAWGLVKHFISVLNNDGWRNVQNRFQQDVVEFSLRIDQSRRFYELAKKTPADTSVRKRILEKMVQGAELSGVALDGDRQKRFNEIVAELAKLKNDFRDHVLDATKAYSVTLTNPVDVEGLPAQLKSAMAEGGDAEKGPWKAKISEDIYYSFMRHSRNRPVREALMRARCTRASSGELDNTAIIDRILALRQEEAKLLGFRNYAELSLAEKCAPSTVAVHRMIDEIASASKPVKAKEDAVLAAFAGVKLEPWDRAYWIERQREKLYSYSEEELMQYFNFPEVLKGMFALANRLFGVTIEECTGDAPVWHRDVRFFRILEDGKTIAHFYIDPFSRPETKRGGAWVNRIHSREVRADGSVQLPLSFIVCNQAVPDASGRALMRFREVETLFHEFGHALQHTLTRVDDACASGTNLIDWDAVEVASQFMENWCYDAKTVRSFARHVETGAPIPEALLERVRAAKNYRAASSSLGQLSMATVDMLLHEGGFKGTPNDLKNRVFKDMTPGTTLPEDRFLNAFSHIFAGGYAAGYYGYKWSEVMSADCFGAFEEAGLDDEEAVRRTGRRYRDTLLALGGGTDPLEVFRLFRGRLPETKALLRQTGLIGQK